MISHIKTIGNIWIDNILKHDIVYTQPGSILYLLYGKKISEQSINIKLGRLGEFLTKEMIKNTPDFELLTCGVQKLDDKKKDVDLIFKNDNTIYYRELKGNIQLDTEKTFATISKCRYIEDVLKNTYPGYFINSGILNWSIYDKNILNKRLNSQLKIFEKHNIHIDAMHDFLNIIHLEWDEDDFYTYFKEIGDKLNRNSL